MYTPPNLRRLSIIMPFVFQAMACRYNPTRSVGKTASAGLDSALAESLYHVRRKTSGCEADICFSSHGLPV